MHTTRQAFSFVIYGLDGLARVGIDVTRILRWNGRIPLLARLLFWDYDISALDVLVVSTILCLLFVWEAARLKFAQGFVRLT